MLHQIVTMSNNVWICAGHDHARIKSSKTFLQLKIRKSVTKGRNNKKTNNSTSNRNNKKHNNHNDILFYQLDAQILYFNTFIIFLYMFRALLCSYSGEQILLVQRLVSSLCLGDCSVHRLLVYWTVT